MSITDGLIGHWPMDELTGNPGDFSGSGNNGTATGTTAGVDGKLSKSRSFNGTSDYVTIVANSTIGNLTSDFTIAAWLNFDNFAIGTQTIWDTAESPSSTVGFEFIVGGGLFNFGTKGVKTYSFTFTGLVQSGAWVHAAVVLDSSFDATLYLDGVARETITHTVGANANTTQATFIGASPNGTSTPNRFWFDGNIDDVRIYNVGLTAAEMHQLFKSGTEHFIKTIRPNIFAPGLAR